MKKFALLLLCSLMLVSCELEDDGPATVQVLVEVAETDLPESFELGKLYEIEVTYLLPNSCHVPLGLQAAREGLAGSERRNIYVAGVAARAAGEEECDGEDEELERVDSFLLRVDENQPYTFYLWKGVDEDDKSIYEEVVVPVVAATSPTTGS